jgi:hypothetical protein
MIHLWRILRSGLGIRVWRPRRVICTKLPKALRAEQKVTIHLIWVDTSLLKKQTVRLVYLALKSIGVNSILSLPLPRFHQDQCHFQIQ